MLGAIGERPVVSLSDPTAEVTAAQAVLDEVSRSVQTAGWHWNTEDEVEFTPVADAVVLDANILRIDVRRTSREDEDYIIKYNGSVKQLYDKEGHSFTISGTIEADLVVYLYSFERIPQAARTYIMLRAARVFQGRYLSDRSRSAEASREEQDAYRELRREEGETGDFNILSTRPVANAVNRPSPFDRMS